MSELVTTTPAITTAGNMPTLPTTATATTTPSNMPALPTTSPPPTGGNIDPVASHIDNLMKTMNQQGGRKRKRRSCKKNKKPKRKSSRKHCKSKKGKK